MTDSQTTNLPWGTRRRVRLPVFETVGAAYRALWTHRDDMLRLAIFPALAVFAINLVLAWKFGMSAAADPREPPEFNSWIYPVMLLAWIPVALFSVNWLRVLLLGSQAVRGFGLGWGRRETMFLVRMILIFLASLAAVIVVSIPLGVIFAIVGAIAGVTGGGQLTPPFTPAGMTAIGILIVIPAILLQLFVMFRLALALPATALDQRRAFHLAWVVVRSNVARLIVTCLLVIIPTYLVLALLQILLFSVNAAAVAPYASHLIMAVLSFIGIAAGSSVLAVAYRRLGGPVPTAA